MRTPLPGFAMILVVGCALLLLAALADRRAHRRLEPNRASVAGSGFDSAPAASSDGDLVPAPGYLTAEQITANAHGLIELTRQQSDTLRQQLAAFPPLVLVLVDPGLVSHVAAASAELAGLSILDNPKVLVCADPVSSIRELLAFLATAGRRLCVAAPAWDRSTVETLVANHLTGRLSVQVLSGPAEPLAQLAQACGGRPVNRSELQSGRVSADAIGNAATVVATTEACWVLTTKLVLS